MTLKNLLGRLSKPAQRALAGAGIATLEELVNYSADDLMAMHGIGENVLAVIRAALRAERLALAGE